jgi:hypothetical protein
MPHFCFQHSQHMYAPTRSSISRSRSKLRSNSPSASAGQVWSQSGNPSRLMHSGHRLMDHWLSPRHGTPTSRIVGLASHRENESAMCAHTHIVNCTPCCGQRYLGTNHVQSEEANRTSSQVAGPAKRQTYNAPKNGTVQQCIRSLPSCHP